MKVSLIININIIIIFIFITANAFCQSDSINKSKEIFSITYLDKNNKNVEVEDVNITYSDSSSLIFQNWVYDVIKSKGSTESHFINYKSVSTFGYKTGTGIGARFRTGALIGMGIGLVAGTLLRGSLGSGDGSGPSFGESFGLGIVGGFIVAIPGGLIGMLTGIGSKEYEVVNISKYDTAKKYEVIQRMMKNGLELNK
ncbi:hypothetical protein BH10BAC5_BH10BAC5_18370 [soil metagenome]